LLDCQICRHKATAKKAPVGKPISAKGIWQRVGIDLIDMSSRPDGDYKWIYHAKDHVSKYSYAIPLKTKTCAEVASATKLMFLLFGAPKILQHDRGGEFCGKVMQELITRDFPDTKVISYLFLIIFFYLLYFFRLSKVLLGGQLPMV
jgi:hypothetical protein